MACGGGQCSWGQRDVSTINKCILIFLAGVYQIMTLISILEIDPVVATVSHKSF